MGVAPKKIDPAKRTAYRCRVVLHLSKEERLMFVERPAEMMSRIFFRFPDRLADTDSTLLCNASEVAVFLQDGACVGILGHGRHALSPATIPCFSTADTTGLDIVFVTTAHLGGIPMEGARTVEDPETNTLVDIRFSGSAVFRVVDPIALLTQVVGTAENDDGLRDFAQEQLVGAAKVAIDELLEKRQSVLGLVNEAGFVEQLHEKIRARSQPLTDCGFGFVDLHALTLGLSAEDKHAMEVARREMASARGASANQEPTGTIPTAADLHLGIHVRAEWKNGGYYACMLIEANGGYFKAKWDDGSEPSWVRLDQIRLEQPPAREVEPHSMPNPYPPGTRVLCPWGDGRVYSATVRQWHNGQYELAWDGNTNTSWVAAHWVRLA
jgi:hypothetical protein